MAGSYNNSTFFFFFEEPLCCFSIVAVSAYIPPLEQGFPVLHIFTSNYYILFFDISHSNRHEAISHYGFD